MHRVLVVDDELPLAESVAYSLRMEGYEVVTAHDGPSAVELIRAGGLSMVLLDIMLPGMDGFEVCRMTRGETKVPIIMLTAKESESDRVVGLELGADDYVTKPFSMRELIARVRAVLRRAARETDVDTKDPAALQVGDLRINAQTRDVTVGGKRVDLSPKEFELLRVLAANAGRVLTRDMLLDSVWGYDFFGDSRTVDVHIRWLREKIEPDPRNPRYITTVRGAGYRLKVPGGE